MTYKIKTFEVMGQQVTNIIQDNGNGSYTAFLDGVDGPEYKAYLAWIEEGNTPEPADEA